MVSAACPNCDGPLEPFREDKQQVGRHAALLQWNICPHCLHVALEGWSLIAADNVEGGLLLRETRMAPAWDGTERRGSADRRSFPNRRTSSRLSWDRRIGGDRRDAP